MSLTAFKQCFRGVYGSSPAAYVRTVRMELAAKTAQGDRPPTSPRSAPTSDTRVLPSSPSPSKGSTRRHAQRVPPPRDRHVLPNRNTSARTGLKRRPARPIISHRLTIPVRRARASPAHSVEGSDAMSTTRRLFPGRCRGEGRGLATLFSYAFRCKGRMAPFAHRVRRQRGGRASSRSTRCTASWEMAIAGSLTWGGALVWIAVGGRCLRS